MGFAARVRDSVGLAEAWLDARVARRGEVGFVAGGATWGGQAGVWVGALGSVMRAERVSQPVFAIWVWVGTEVWLGVPRR